MKTGINTSQQQSQQLGIKLNQNMAQSLNILSLNVEQLQQHIENITLSNCLLELDNNDDHSNVNFDTEDNNNGLNATKTQEESQSLHQSLQNNINDDAQSTEQLINNTDLSWSDICNETDYSNADYSNYDEYTNNYLYQENNTDFPDMLTNYTSDIDLLQELKQQIMEYNWPSKLEELIAHFIIDDLDEDGYFRTSRKELLAIIKEYLQNDDTLYLLQEIQHQEQLNLHIIQKVLTTIQKNFLPVGIAATDLLDCLLLQLNYVEKCDKECVNSRGDIKTIKFIDYFLARKILLENLGLMHNPYKLFVFYLRDYFDITSPKCLLYLKQLESFSFMSIEKFCKDIQQNKNLSQYQVTSYISLLRTYQLLKSFKTSPMSEQPISKDITALPDLSVRVLGKTEGADRNSNSIVYTIELFSHKLKINQQIFSQCQQQFKQNSKSVSANNFNKVEYSKLKTDITEAKNLKYHLEFRGNTLLKISKLIVAHQNKYIFEQGALKPLSQNELAIQLGLNPSTITRAIANKYINTPRGVLMLKNLLSSKLEIYGGKDLAQQEVIQEIKNIIKNEPSNKPLSDLKIVNILRQDKNVDIARRTVVKYRKFLKIPSSSKRKQIV